MISKASVGLYAEVSLIGLKLEANEKFNDRMHHYKTLFWILSNNRNEKDAPWNLQGGIAITVDEHFRPHQTKNDNVMDKTVLGRLTWIQIRGKREIHTRYLSTYKPCKNKTGLTTWTQEINYFQTNKKASLNQIQENFLMTISLNN